MNPDITAPSLSSVRRYHPTPALDFAAYFFNSLLVLGHVEALGKI